MAPRPSYHYPRECAVPADGVLTRVSRGSLPVALEDALFHLRIDAGTEDNYVTELIQSVQDELEPPNGWLGRALTTTEFKLSLPWFANRIKLAGAPIQAVSAVKYRDTSGTVQTVSPDVYRLTDEAIPSIVLQPGQCWPTDAVCDPDAVTIEYTAGFGDQADAVPVAIKQYIKLMIAHRYDVRSAVIVGTIATPTPYVRDMIDNWRVHL